LSLRLNFAWTLAGNVIFSASQWGITVALARLAGPEGVGRFALAVALTTPIVMLSNLNLRGVQATDTTGRFSFSEYFSLRLLTAAAALAGMVLLACTSNYGIATLFVVIAVACAKSSESLSDVCYGQLQQRESMDRIAISMTLRGVLSVAGLTAVLLTTGSLPWACAATAAAWLAVLWAYDLPNMKMHGTRRDLLRAWRHVPFDRLKALVALAAPLGAVMMLLALNSSIPRYFIERGHGFRELGIFAAIASLNAAGTIVISALGQSATPRLASLYAQGDYQLFRRLLGRLAGLGLLIGIGGVLAALFFGRDILRLLYGSQFSAGSVVLVWVMAYAAVSYVASFFGYALTAARRFKVQLPIFSGLTALTVVFCFWLVPRSGAVGAAQALLLTGIAQGLMMACALYRTLRHQEKAVAE
jgi:O-antigen/teichoic acid export membrane protein